MSNPPSFSDVMRVTGNINATSTLLDVEASALYECCLSVPKDGIVVEVGCQLGRSSSLINQMAMALGFHSIHIDPYTSQPVMLKAWVEMVHRIGGDFTHEFTLMCMRTEQAAWLLSKIGEIDLAYIDGDHEQCGVEIDLRLVANNVKAGGYLVVHDYFDPSITEQYPDPHFPGVLAAMKYYLSSGYWAEIGVFGGLGVWKRR